MNFVLIAVVTKMVLSLIALNYSGKYLVLNSLRANPITFVQFTLKFLFLRQFPEALLTPNGCACR